jgi:hypothetical protein
LDETSSAAAALVDPLFAAGERGPVFSPDFWSIFMIVYVVKRRWLEKKAEAEAYRVSLGLKPSATVQISVSTRFDLCALLNALCDPPTTGSVPPAAGRAAPVVPSQVIDTAFIDPHLEIPDFIPRFLLDDAGRKLWDEHHAAKEKS